MVARSEPTSQDGHGHGHIGLSHTPNSYATLLQDQHHQQLLSLEELKPRQQHAPVYYELSQ